MGNLFQQCIKPKCSCNHKLNNSIIESSNNNLSNNELTDIIAKYEYIKNCKNIRDNNTLFQVMKNTDWNKTELNNNYTIQPSAPSFVYLLDDQMPIAVPVNRPEIIKRVNRPL